MCLIWTVKYNICGCICERESIYCSPYQYCWGPRAIIFHSNLQTCEDCWNKGDKRVNESIAKILNRLAEEKRQRDRRRNEQSRSQTCKVQESTKTDKENLGGRCGRKGSESAEGHCEDAELDTDQNMQEINEDRCEPREFRHEDTEAEQHIEDGECVSRNPSSRPNTPVRNLALDPDYTPPWLLSVEQNCELTRVCDPVRVSSISRDHRAPRRRTDWYALEDGLGVYLGPGADQILDSEQVREGFMRIWEEAGISSGLLKAWIELEKAAM